MAIWSENCLEMMLCILACLHEHIPLILFDPKTKKEEVLLKSRKNGVDFIFDGLKILKLTSIDEKR